MALERDVELVLGEVLLLPDALFGHPDRDAGAPVLHRRRLGAEAEEAPGRLALKGEKPTAAPEKNKQERAPEKKHKQIAPCTTRPHLWCSPVLRPRATPRPSLTKRRWTPTPAGVAALAAYFRTLRVVALV